MTIETTAVKWPKATAELLAPSDTDTAYAAGVFDGEGTVALTLISTRAGRRPIAQVHVTNQNTDLLEWLRARWGGQIYELVGNRRHGWAICWSLQFTTQDEKRAFLTAVTPHLIVKRQFAEIGLRFLRYRRQGTVAYSPAAEAARMDLYRQYRELRGDAVDDEPLVVDDDQLLMQLEDE